MVTVSLWSLLQPRPKIPFCHYDHLRLRGRHAKDAIEDKNISRSDQEIKYTHFKFKNPTCRVKDFDGEHGSMIAIPKYLANGLITVNLKSMKQQMEIVATHIK